MIRRLEVDGVPTLLAATSGPPRAGLTFRVGSADETLARRGITHLLEHLALVRLGLGDHHVNGETSALFTTFHTQAGEDDIARFLTAVCENLHDPPVARIEVEKQILRTEWNSRGVSVDAAVPLWRHGARDHGLSGYPELGLPAITEADLRRWAAHWFTRENAVLWIAGDRLPDGLRLPLPHGARRPVPKISSALPQTPAYFASGGNAVVLDAVVRHRTAAAVFAGVLERELYRSLRQEDGLSYTTTTGYQWRGDGHAVVRAVADALPEKQDAVLGGVVDALATMRVGRIMENDLAAVVVQRTTILDAAEVHAARLPAVAASLLTGEPSHGVEEIRAELATVSVADLHEVAQEVAASALLMVPAGLDAQWAGFAAAPVQSDESVSGSVHRTHDGEGELVIGEEGVTLLGPDSTQTVRFAATAALLVWPDGARHLIGEDAISVRIEPTLFEPQPDVVDHLDARVPVERRIEMPARSPEEIPQPPPRPNLLVRSVTGLREGLSALTAWLSVVMFDAERGGKA
ncbi:insulinase family protein [Micromonospora sp. 15K316]|uniref:M16 family metallopeptidase n=1 Tax=Micromonospora sp. 15K316 TaxID=2530376 RepID=UPI0010504D2B|nr:insulinase family protein [Micromonospora sp. 15K316]TDC28810.1 insulinase family protein [Micromonospora sp. 15K316]